MVHGEDGKIIHVKDHRYATSAERLMPPRGCIAFSPHPALIYVQRGKGPGVAARHGCAAELVSYDTSAPGAWCSAALGVGG